MFGLWLRKLNLSTTHIYHKMLEVELLELRSRRAKAQYEKLLKTPHAWDQIEIAKFKMEISEERYRDALMEFCLL